MVRLVASRAMWLAALVLLACTWAIPRRTASGKGRPVRGPHTIEPSLRSLTSIDAPGGFALTSVTVQHRGDARWYVPHYHAKDSAGWNRTVVNSHLDRPVVCNIRFFAVGLEKTLQGFTGGGTAYLTLYYTTAESKKTHYHGFNRNETGKLHCYYMTSKGYGSEFLDSPKTDGIAVYCPLSMDSEVGEYAWAASMAPGYFCRVLSDHATHVSLHLRPTAFQVPLDYAQRFVPTDGELVAEALTEPLAARHLKVTDYFSTAGEGDGGAAAAAAVSGAGGGSGAAAAANVYRPHAVCTVQTFRNSQTGPMLYLFVSYYHRMGWRVVVYDRFGFHREFIEDLLPLPGFDYYNYTIFQMVNPMKYSAAYARQQGFGFKIYYAMEKNWGYATKTNGTMADVADQDADKARTYDHR